MKGYHNDQATTIAILLASIGVATTAAAEGDYYEGVDRQATGSVQPTPDGRIPERRNTFFFPRSDFLPSSGGTYRIQPKAESGEYYGGAIRPN